jgi:hypothetical protein
MADQPSEYEFFVSEDENNNNNNNVLEDSMSISSEGSDDSVDSDDSTNSRRSIGPFPCVQCGKIFRTTFSLKQHQHRYYLDTTSCSLVLYNHTWFLCVTC